MSGIRLADLKPELVVLWPRPSICGGASRRGRAGVRDTPFAPELFIADVGGRIGGGFFVGIDGEVDTEVATPFAPEDECIFSGRLILLILH